MVSIIVPIYNEKENIKDLLVTIHQSFSGINENYEVIAVDDNSTDGSWEILEQEKLKYPLNIFKKKGRKGKAFSLFEGFVQASGEYIVMIDSDLQYPPEAIPQMISKLKKYDIVVANRKNYRNSFLRKLISKSFNYLFAKLLFNLNCDVQSGLKAFRKEVISVSNFRPKSAWTFDLEFLVRAREAGFSIHSQDITFFKRKSGKSKIHTLPASFEIGANAIKLRLKRFIPQLIPSESDKSMLGAGVGYKRKKYITHTTLPYGQSAIISMNSWQKALFLILFLITIYGLLFKPLTGLIIIIAILSLIYFLDLIFNLFLIFKTMHSPPEITFSKEELDAIGNEKLPLYTILCPLYKEANVLPGFLKSIGNLDWPKDKIDAILLLEDDDRETADLLAKINLPDYVRALVVPPSVPKTKPKACNFGLAHARGEYLVIYDAEDIPDPLQLKKTYLTF